LEKYRCAIPENGPFPEVFDMAITAVKQGGANHESQIDRHALLVTHKSELIGELAQAMANQFNNIMMAVTGYAELELKKANSKEKRSLEQMLNQATRATFLIQKLLDFSRARVPSPQYLELDTALNEVRELVVELIGERAELTFALGAESGRIHVDRVELEKTLFALLVVARDAMSGNGKLTISTSVVDLERTFIGAQAANPGKHAILSVESHGAALTGAAHTSTPENSHANELSLAAVREIVKDCHGLAGFSVESGGCSLKLYFPVATCESIAEEERTLPRNPAVARTILIVEDDDAVRIPAAEFLMMEGFKVLQARTGSEALSVVQQSRSSLDILVTDMLMPKMNGHEVAASLLEQHPDLKILYISGDPARGALAGGVMPKNATLRKPFRLNVLRDKIHDLLGE
jgi:two-component system, cell cycle sensor histidine kinase and response regulator CckA